MSTILNLPEIQQVEDDETTIVIKSKAEGIKSIRINDSDELEVSGRIKETFNNFLETDRQIKNIENLIGEKQKEKERLYLELNKFVGKLKRMVVEN
jgi:hypothetical protein